jgi:signal transduction histidine kinase/ActR/RegA family two-component response regulator
MSRIGSSFFRSGFGPDHTSIFSRKNILVVYLMAVALNSWLFYLIPPGYYERNANLVASLAAMAMIPLAWRRQYFPYVVHSATLLGLVLVTYIAAESGGVNSMAVVWLNVLALPVLLLLGPLATLAWIVIILLTILGLFLATLNGVIDSHANMTQQAVPWAAMNSVLAVANLMLGVRLYEHLHDQQLKQLHLRNEELKATHLALLQAQAHKDEFVAAVGHELRTPMNAILGFNGVLREELSDQAEQVEVVDHIRRSTGHLLQVVNDILDFSQLQAGKLQLYCVDFVLADMVAEAVGSFQDKAREKNLLLTRYLDPALPMCVHADRQRVLQTLRNLLDNGLKFTEQGAVSLRVLARDGFLRFEISDTGRGIALAQQAQIFRRFEHADVQTTRTYGGTGLGLSICEKLVTLQGGRIGVESREGKGALFWFEIPLQAARSALVSALPETPNLGDAPLRILVVDDNAMNLMVARLQLQKCWPKAQVVTASSAAEALVILDEQGFDIALIDMIMPELDGLQLTQQIRQRFPAITVDMPILALTANTNPVDRQRCLDAGMNGVLDKPMDLDILVRVVTQQVAQARSRQHG